MLSKGQEMVARLEPGQSQRERACLAVQPRRLRATGPSLIVEPLLNSAMEDALNTVRTCVGQFIHL